MANLIQMTRSKIIQHRANLISQQEIINWADSVISEMVEPPAFILDLAVWEIPIQPNVLVKPNRTLI